MSSAESVRTQFQWEDATVYQWSLWIPKMDTGELIGGLLGIGVLFPLMVYGLFWGISFWSPEWSYWLCVVGCVVLVLTVIYSASQCWTGTARRRKEARAEVYSLNVALMGGLLFLLNSPHSQLAPGFTLVAPAAPSALGVGFWQWVLFFIDNTFSVLLLDITEIFNLQLSRIQYQDWSSRTVTVAIRLLITAGLVEVAWQTLRQRFGKEQLYGTVQECYWHCTAVLDPKYMHVRCQGRLDVLGLPPECAVEHLIKAFKEEADVVRKKEDA